MRELLINKNDAGQRLDRFVLKALPALPSPLLQKYIRLKRIKLNGKAAQRDAHLSEGDRLELYINDEFFEKPDPEKAFSRITTPSLSILYEDENIILADKQPGMPVIPDETEATNTLIANLQAYLYKSGQWKPDEENSFAPALCNRIDRNTGGIVIAAKNAESLRIMNEKIRDRELKKYYLAVVHGRLAPPSGRLSGFLLKEGTLVRVLDKPAPGAKTAHTLYKTLCFSDGLTLVECELITGRTHQIRAQMSAAGHPLLGDGKYGSNTQNQPYNRKFQALYSYRLVFAFKSPAGLLSYLNGKEFTVKDVPFVRQYFVDYGGF